MEKEEENSSEIRRGGKRLENVLRNKNKEIKKKENKNKNEKRGRKNKEIEKGANGAIAEFHVVASRVLFWDEETTDKILRFHEWLPVLAHL